MNTKKRANEYIIELAIKVKKNKIRSTKWVWPVLRTGQNNKVMGITVVDTAHSLGRLTEKTLHGPLMLAAELEYLCHLVLPHFPYFCFMLAKRIL